MRLLALAAVVLLSIAARADAGTIAPLSYDMPNGFTGSYNYWDDTYNGSGDNTVDGAALTGGLGDLTDGVVASDNWFVVEPAGAGPYVGWADIDPTIVFKFDKAYLFDLVRIHFDDSDGTGGVASPRGVRINGAEFSISDPAGSAPFWAEFSLAGLAASELTIQLLRNDRWVFASEFEFQSTPTGVVPEPSTLVLSLLGFGGLIAAGIRRRDAR